MELAVRRPHKSIKLGEFGGVELSMLTVLTGHNGAGKSNLLEALQSNAVVVDQFGELPNEQVRLFRLGELLAVAEGPVTAAAYREPWANLYNNVQQYRQQAENHQGLSVSAERESYVENQVLQSKLITRSAMNRMIAELDKPLSQMTADEWREHAPLIAGVKDPFAASIAEVFMSYSQRRSMNEMAQWRLATKGRGSALTDDEFQARFGAPPWQLLDETLNLVSLPYRFSPPPEDTDSINYEVQLVDADSNSIRPGDLSSGERVLLAVAMSLFTGASKINETIELPRLLLLDEADASLHPSMVKSLLMVVQEIFVKQYGVMVIMTTHSPSTVALAPDDALFVMSRSGQRLRAASTDEALKILTVGISSLSVRLENRRQIFVESEYDQAVYQDLYRIVKGSIDSDHSAEFIAAGKRESGGGCAAVKRLVTDLRQAGNSTVLGIVDRDNRGGAAEHIYYLADRYSVENLLLDPLIFGCFLLRENIVTAAELGLPVDLRHFEIGSCHAQVVVNALTEKLGLSSGEAASCEYNGHFSADVPLVFLNTRGHDLEDHVVSVFPQLKQYKKFLKREVVNRAVADMPALLPISIVRLFEELLTA